MPKGASTAEKQARVVWETTGRQTASVFARSHPEWNRRTVLRWVASWKAETGNASAPDPATGSAPAPAPEHRADVDDDGRTVTEQLSDLRAVSVGVVRSLLTSPGTPPQVQLGALREVMDRSGLVPPRRGTPLPASDDERRRQELVDAAVQAMRALSVTRIRALLLLRDPETPEELCEAALAALTAEGAQLQIEDTVGQE